MSTPTQPIFPAVTNRHPRVLISGAGLAGLLLGILLEKAGIPYDIYERAAEIKPIGAVMSLSPNILTAFEQLGLYEELMSFSKEAIDSTFYTDQLDVVTTNAAITADLVGYECILFARPELYDLLYRQIPSSKVHFSMKVVSFEQDKKGVTITLGDNTTVRGDILVGADGAHSAVRTHLYKALNKQGLLPRSDTEAMSVSYISLVGTTDALDPTKYPCVLRENCNSSFIIGDKKTPYTWCTFTIPGNRICWNVIIQLGLDPVADELAGSPDWVVQENNKKMMDSIRHFKTPYGTMGDLFDVTQIERVSKVSFEDKLFETWNHGRVVLVGDAAHKLLPSTGAGAVNAMQDSVLLGNHIYDIHPTSHENIKAALSDYKEERFDAVKEQYPQSYISAKIMYGHTLSERILRQVVFNWLPESIKRKQLLKDTAYRPQANFLPLVPKREVFKRIQKEKEEEEGKKIPAAL
ncbi:hypothetical protein BG015_011478 [Linnemannia schmuckeri]|uniref:FAD-binding domain-containing protein n=1 Tax=Linnemannia schmuckeri TaxID=64567 RepID=A0A9P5V8B9_9FUNG|nr:hypothetical protein BG015_011478 [Linnemannia schmuckeri]